MKKIFNYLNETIKKEKYLLNFNIIVFMIGLIIGTIFINFITKTDRVLLKEQLSLFLDNIKKLTTDVFGFEIFLNDFLSNFLELTIIFILGISMIGLIFVIFYLFFKGFMLGVSLSTFIVSYSYKGIIGMVLYLVPFYIINILIYFFISFFAIDASIKFIKALIKKEKLDFKTFFGKYLLSYLISIILIVIYCLGNCFIMPILLKLFTFII